MKPIRIKSVVVEVVSQHDMKVFYILGNDVGQSSVLRLIPNGFHRIKVGSIRGKPFDTQPIVAVGE